MHECNLCLSFSCQIGYRVESWWILARSPKVSPINDVVFLDPFPHPITYTYFTKGHLSSKKLFLLFNSPKKRTKKFCPSRPQVLGRLFAPSQKSKKLSHHFGACFELGIGILNAPRKIFLVVYEPILKLQGLVAVEFQGKNGFTKMASNFFEIDCGFR